MADQPDPPKTYDAGEFLPASRAEIAAAAEGRNLFNAWFGRRDRIPDGDDPRTKLIDRGMVAHGHATPERLAEIHTTGAEYDRLKPEDALIHAAAARTADAAVQADREERARRKIEKKAAAAERDRRRAAAVAQSRATDILFLGRGVSAQLGHRASDDGLLNVQNLPNLHTPADVARAIGIPVPQLRWLAFHSEVVTKAHYVRFAVKKRSGGERVLAAPHAKLKAVQRWILAEVVGKLALEEPAHGFVPGRGIVSNATPHVGHAIVLNLDLKDFFPSIGYRRVRHVFRRAGFSGAVATVFALLCTECPRRPVTFAGQKYEVATGPLALPQGAPTSPALSNLVARRLDQRLAGLAAKFDLTYTRYADDLTFSGGQDAAAKVGYLIAKVRHVAREEGFTVNEAKTQVMRRNRAQEVTGVVVNDKPSVSREDLRRLRAIFHRAKTEGLDAQNRDGRPNFRAWLEGTIAFVRMVRPDAGEKLRRELDQLGPT